MNSTVIASLISSATTLTGMITIQRQTKTLKTHATDALTTPTPKEAKKR